MILETFNAYHVDNFREQDISTIIRIEENKIYLDRTIFYAESGGQENDIGTIIVNNIPINIYDVQYEKTEKKWRTAHYFTINEDNKNFLKVGDKALMKIDSNRRKKLSAYHTASHILFIAAEKFRSGVQKNVIGCHIKEDSARFDFKMDKKFDDNEIVLIENYVNKIICKGLDIKTYFKDDNTNERIWECNNEIILCGGTHLSNTAMLNFLKVKRKGIGKGKDRLICYTENIINEEY